MVTDRPAQIISGIWTEILHNLRGALDNINSNTQQVELKRLEFHATDFYQGGVALLHLNRNFGLRRR